MSIFHHRSGLRSGLHQSRRASGIGDSRTLVPAWLTSQSPRAASERLAIRCRRLSLRRAVCAVCAGLLAWCVISAIGMQHATCAIYVAARDITLGEHVDASALRTVWVPQDSAAKHALAPSSAGTSVGGFAQLPIARGEPIFPGMLSSDALATQGRTSVDLQLASSADHLVPGDMVNLMTSQACGNADADADDAGGLDGIASPNGTGSSGNAASAAGTDSSSGAVSDMDSLHGTTASCVLAQEAVVLKVTQPQSTAFSKSDSPTVTLALTPEEALHVLDVSGSNPIIAVQCEAQTSANAVNQAPS